MEEDSSTRDDKTERYREIFKLIDRDGSGAVDKEELTVGLRALGCNPTTTEIQAMIDEADGKVNENGKLEFDEFCDMMSRHEKSIEEVEADLLKAFLFFDKNGDGNIDKDELRESLKQLGYDAMTDEDVDELFVEADVDDNGKIDYRELVHVICKT